MFLFFVSYLFLNSSHAQIRLAAGLFLFFLASFFPRPSDFDVPSVCLYPSRSFNSTNQDVPPPFFFLLYFLLFTPSRPVFCFVFFYLLFLNEKEQINKLCVFVLVKCSHCFKRKRFFFFFCFVFLFVNSIECLDLYGLCVCVLCLVCCQSIWFVSI